MATDRHSLRFAPHIGHWNANTVILDDGSLLASYHLQGFPSELAGAIATIRLKMVENQAARSLSDPRIEIWDHYVRQDRQTMTTLPSAANWFASRFDAAYVRTQGEGMYRNDLFLTVVMHPEDSVASGIEALFGSGRTAHPQSSNAMKSDFEDVLHRLQATLSRYGARRLGLRDRDRFSEVFEAFHLIANGYFRPVGLLDQDAILATRMGRLIVPERVSFDDGKPGDWRIFREGPGCYGAMLSIKDYPAGTDPTMFAGLRNAPYSLTLTNSWRFQRKARTIKFLGAKFKQMKSANDASKTQAKQVGTDEDDVMSGHSVYGYHHFSCAVRANSLEQLDRNMAHAQSQLSDAGVTAIRETDAIKPGFYSQVPGNGRWRPRPAPIKSINWVSFAARHNVPRGRMKGRWGAPIVMLRTTAETEYAFHFQVQGSAQIPAEDLGNCLICGPAGSGKTSLLGTVCLLALRVPTARVVIIDKDYGLSVMAKAAGGSHMLLRAGVDGLAPLKALSDEPDDIAHLQNLCRALILSDEQGELSNDDDERMRRGIALQMAMPPEMRSFGGIAAMLGKRGTPGKEAASQRLRRWCRGERLGWVVDGEADHLHMGARLTCIDTTSFLKDTLTRGPILSHLFYRTRKLITGLPLVFAIDEAWVLDTVAESAAECKDQLKTIRKNEGVVLLATQSPGLALKSPNADDYKQQIPTKIFFADDSASRKDLVHGMGCTEAEYLTITTVLPSMPHTFLVKRPGGSVLCRLDLSGAMHMVAVVSARRGTYELMLRLIDRYGPDPQAWVPHYERQAPGLADEPTVLQFEHQEAAE